MTQHNKPDDNQIQEVAEAYLKKPETGKSEFSDATHARNNADDARKYGTTENNANPPEPSDSRVIQSPQQLVTEHLDLWTSTVTPKSTSGRGSNSKIELTGIKKLRELILELAVRGKLVAQNPDDEPASKLLERIEAEKAQLIKDGKLKKQKPLAAVSDDEKPFELPEGWEWCRLAKLGWITSSSRVKQKDWKKEGIPFFRAREIVQLSKKGKVDNELYISDDLFQELTKTGTTPEPDDVMLTGVGTIGVPYLVQANDLFYFKDASVLIFKNVTGMYPQYLLKFFKCPLWINSIHKESMGTTVHTLTIIRASETLLPLPPLAEQQRIVAKVDELMALCDQLEQQSEHQLTAHQQLTDTLLATLTVSANAQELNDNWQRLANHFDLLFSGPMGAWAIDRLKDTILQLAVMGKLVPQNPDDEPASELLERIEEEKARLIKKGKIKKPKKLPPVSDEEKPFELPEGWEWCRLPEIGELARGKSKHRPRNDPNLYKEGKYPLIQTGDVARSNGSISTYGATYNDFGLQQSRLWPAHTLCITIAANIADTGLLEFDACFPDSVVGFNGFLGVSNRFYEFFVRTYKEKLAEFAPSTAQKNINLEILSSMLIPVSPLPEQQRIVSKVDVLFVLCDHLKDRLQKASETEQHLTNAIVEQALS